MQYQYGKVISLLLSQYLQRFTSDADLITVIAKYQNTKHKRSHSTVKQLRNGAIPLTEDTQVYIDELFKIAVKNQREERKRFEPLLEKAS